MVQDMNVHSYNRLEHTIYLSNILKTVYSAGLRSSFQFYTFPVQERRSWEVAQQ